MADESVTPATESSPASVADAPAASSSAASPELAPSSFSAALQQAATGATSTTPATFTQADFDSRLATEKANWEKQYEWAKDYDPNELPTWRESVQLARTNPVEAATQLLAHALANPEHKASALKFASNLLAGRVQAPVTEQPNQDGEPQPDLEANGHALYSAKQLDAWRAWNERQLTAKLDERFKPLETARQSAEDAQREAVAQQQRHDFATQQLTAAMKWEGFTANQDEIAKVLQTMDNRDPMQAALNLRDAYVQVVVPKLRANSSEAAASDNARRAAANTGRVVSSAPTQTSPAAKPSFGEALRLAAGKQRAG